jgi:hypothetical protein
MAASPASPLTGQCACGGVRFRITAPFVSARYCHCHRCQRRTGTVASPNARLPREAYELLEGKQLLRSWQPPDGMGKWFCAGCGGQLYSANEGGDAIFVRLGTIDGDPGIRPEYHQWVSSAPTWEPIPDDGLPRYPEGGP